MAIYTGIDGSAKSVSKIYTGVGGTARPVHKGYILSLIHISGWKLPKLTPGQTRRKPLPGSSGKA